MREQSGVAFATAVFSKRDQIMLLRPVENLIAATFLSFEKEVKPTAEFSPQVPEVEIDKKELELARTLVAQLETEELDLGQYRDTYAENLQKFIEAKVAGQEIVAPPVEQEPQVINLMEALQKSIDSAKAKARPPKLAAPSTAQKRGAAAPARKRKQA